MQYGYAIHVVTILAVHSVYTECKGKKNRAQFLVCAHILIPIYHCEELYFGLTSTSDLRKTLICEICPGWFVLQLLYSVIR